ncbi:MAG: carbohydrate ABC transporter permease [Spirochaetia bacterium]|jgi:raffinose/stachyose/melibiose transport system permease protein
MKSKRIIIYIGAILICVVMFFPFIWGFILSFKNNTTIYNEPLGLPAKLDFALYIDTFLKSNMGNLFKNSLIVTTITTLGCLFINLPSSFAIARLHHRHEGFGNFFYYVFLLGAAVPLFIILYPVYTIALTLKPLGIGTNSIYGLPFPYIAGSIPFNTLVFVGAMKGVPLELEEAGIIDGCGVLRIFITIVVPLIAPIIATLIIFNFLWAWNEWTLASILLSSIKNFTIPLAASFFKQQYGQDLAAMMRAVIMMLIPQIIFYFFFQRQIVEGMATTGLKA